jgi:hypothetical protein
MQISLLTAKKLEDREKKKPEAIKERKNRTFRMNQTRMRKHPSLQIFKKMKFAIIEYSLVGI